jgi:beta-N-acetylhexosaminidase
VSDSALLRLAEAVVIPPFTGSAPPRWVLDALGRGLAGVTLYGHNVLGDTAALTAALRSACDSEPVLAIDEEGGDVTRVAYVNGSPYPGNAALGAVDDVGLTQQVHWAIGADLAALGINLDMAPCADVLGTADSPAIGTRSFGSDTDLVARHTAAAVTGLQTAGVAACAKHFPGHGSTSTDTHQALATIEGTLEDLRRRDLPPFSAAIKAGVVAIMPSHLRVPELTGDLAASVSAAAITGLLRGDLGFDGVVISDALEMKALRDLYGIPGAAVRAVAAGTDLLCFGRETDEEMYLAVRTALVDAVRSGELPAARLEESAERVAALRARLASARQLPAPAVPPDRIGPDGIGPDGIGLTAARRAIRLSGPRRALASPLIIEIEPRENIAAGQFGWGLRPWAPPASIRRVSVNRDGAAHGVDVPGIVADAADRSLVVAVRDAHVDERTRALITELLAARPDTVLVEMGLPHWSPPPGTAYLATFGASRASAQATAELLGLAAPLPPQPRVPPAACPAGGHTASHHRHPGPPPPPRPTTATPAHHRHPGPPPPPGVHHRHPGPAASVPPATTANWSPSLPRAPTLCPARCLRTI